MCICRFEENFSLECSETRRRSVFVYARVKKVYDVCFVSESDGYAWYERVKVVLES